MPLLLISACPNPLPLKKHLESFSEVKTLYSPFWDLPPADFSFALRFETLGQVPWGDFDGIVACGGSRLCSLAAENARLHGIPAFLIFPHRHIFAFQAPNDPLLNFSNKILTPAFQAPPIKEDLFSYIHGKAFQNSESSVIEGGPFGKISPPVEGSYDLVSVACSEDTSSVSSSEALNLDIRPLAEIIRQSGALSLQRVSSLFAEFLWEGKRLMLYRQGRISLSPCEDAEEVFFAYQFFLNS